MYSIFSNENKEIKPHQKLAIDGVFSLFELSILKKHALLYHSMGKGKTMTAVQIAKNAIDANHCDSLLVVAPPSTHKDWNALFEKYIDVQFKVVSLQWLIKNKEFLRYINKETLVIIDEIHLASNRGKEGTKVATAIINRAFGSLLMSGTPFRNKEERLFVVHDWLFGDAKNYENWLNEYCNTIPDRFAYYPKFVSFKAGEIEDYLEQIDRMPYKKIFIEKEDMEYKTTFEYLPILNNQYNVLEKYSVYGKERLIVANSVMRKLRYMSYLKYCGYIEADIENDTCTLHEPRQDILEIINRYSPRNPIIYAQSSKVARFYADLYPDSLYIDGKTTKKNKDLIFSEFKRGGKILFATDSISTGTDGAQEATDCILVLYDTNDNTSRDQLIGRIAGGFRNKGNAEIVFVTFA